MCDGRPEREERNRDAEIIAAGDGGLLDAFDRDPGLTRQGMRARFPASMLHEATGYEPNVAARGGWGALPFYKPPIAQEQDEQSKNVAY